MRLPRMIRPILLSDAGIAFFIGLITAIAGSWYYQGPGRALIDVNTFDYEPAVLWACGHGYHHAMVKPAALEEFLGKGRKQLDPADLPENLAVLPANGENDVDRIYLQYAIGLIWRVLGIDWAWFSLLVGLGGGLCAAFLYGIFRLGMGRLASVAGTVLAMSSPLTLVMLPCLRDYWKGPFVLATILIIGRLIARPIRAGRLLLLSCALGVIIGIGYGFRQDCIICLPPAVLAVAIAAHRKDGPLRVVPRVLAAALVMGAFWVVASPVLVMIRNTGGTNGLYLLQGNAVYCQDTMKMRRACYAPVAQTDDAFVEAVTRVFNARYTDENVLAVSEQDGGLATAAVHVFNPLINAAAPPKKVPEVGYWRAYRQALLLRGVAHALLASGTGMLQAALNLVAINADSSQIYGYWDKRGIEYAQRRLTVHLASLLPADFISRWYGATAHIIRGMRGYAATPGSVNPREGVRGNPDHDVEPVARWYSVHLFIGRHLEKWGEYYALAALFIIAMHSFWMAGAVLCLLLYFCGYTGLYFQERHTFHLGFVAFWLFLFFVGRLFRLLRAIVSREERQALLLMPGGVRTTFPCIRRACLFLVAAFVVLALPLAVARHWQRDKVAHLLQPYQDCELEPVPVELSTDPEGRACYRVPEMPQKEILPRYADTPGQRTDPIPELLCDYYVAEFETPAPCPPLTIRTLYADCMWDCICSMRDDYDVGEPGGPFTVRYFFPAYEFRDLHEIGHKFVGVALPPGCTLKNMYRVANQQDFPLPMNLWLFDAPEHSRDHAAFSLFGRWI